MKKNYAAICKNLELREVPTGYIYVLGTCANYAEAGRKADVLGAAVLAVCLKQDAQDLAQALSSAHKFQLVNK